jgi:hypothetical protein
VSNDQLLATARQAIAETRLARGSGAINLDKYLNQGKVHAQDGKAHSYQQVMCQDERESRPC